MESSQEELNDWKQIIPDPKRRIFVDKWIQKFRVVEKKMYHARDIIAVINNTGYKPGGGNNELDDFIEWASKISYVDLPDHIISHEILNEIDVNMLELKTKREKDLYLTKLAGVLNLVVGDFLTYAKTHPDYAKAKGDYIYNDETQEVCFVETHKEIPLKPWRQLNQELRNRGIDSPALTEFYIQVLVEVEILNKIIDYIEELINPYENISILNNEIVSNSHKLVLLHKIGLFEPLYNKYYQHLGAVKFTKLIATLLGVAPEKHNGFRPSVNALIKEILKPSTKKIVQTEQSELKVSAFLAEIGLITKL